MLIGYNWPSFCKNSWYQSERTLARKLPSVTARATAPATYQRVIMMTPVSIRLGKVGDDLACPMIYHPR